MPLSVKGLCTECFTLQPIEVSPTIENIECRVCGHATPMYSSDEIYEIQQFQKKRQLYAIIALICAGFAAVVAIAFYFWQIPTYTTSGQSFPEISGLTVTQLSQLPDKQRKAIGDELYRHLEAEARSPDGLIVMQDAGASDFKQNDILLSVGGFDKVEGTAETSGMRQIGCISDLGDAIYNELYSQSKNDAKLRILRARWMSDTKTFEVKPVDVTIEAAASTAARRLPKKLEKEVDSNYYVYGGGFAVLLIAAIVLGVIADLKALKFEF